MYNVEICFLESNGKRYAVAMNEENSDDDDDENDYNDSLSPKKDVFAEVFELKTSCTSNAESVSPSKDDDHATFKDNSTNNSNGNSSSTSSTCSSITTSSTSSNKDTSENGIQERRKKQRHRKFIQTIRKTRNHVQRYNNYRSALANNHPVVFGEDERLKINLPTIPENDKTSSTLRDAKQTQQQPGLHPQTQRQTQQHQQQPKEKLQEQGQKKQPQSHSYHQTSTSKNLMRENDDTLISCFSDMSSLSSISSASSSSSTLQERLDELTNPTTTTTTDSFYSEMNNSTITTETAQQQQQQQQQQQHVGNENQDSSNFTTKTKTIEQRKSQARSQMRKKILKRLGASPGRKKSLATFRVIQEEETSDEEDAATTTTITQKINNCGVSTSLSRIAMNQNLSIKTRPNERDFSNTWYKDQKLKSRESVSKSERDDGSHVTEDLSENSLSETPASSITDHSNQKGRHEKQDTEEVLPRKQSGQSRNSIPKVMLSIDSDDFRLLPPTPCVSPQQNHSSLEEPLEATVEIKSDDGTPRILMNEMLLREYKSMNDVKCLWNVENSEESPNLQSSDSVLATNECSVACSIGQTGPESLKLFMDDYPPQEYSLLLDSIYSNDNLQKLTIIRRRHEHDPGSESNDRYSNVRTDEDVQSLFQLLGHRSKTLKELELRNFEDRDVPLIVNGMRDSFFENLHYFQLYLNSGTVTDDLMQMIKGLPSLISLELEVHESFPASILLERQEVQSLKILSITCNHFEFSYGDVEAIAQVLRDDDSSSSSSSSSLASSPIEVLHIEPVIRAVSLRMLFFALQNNFTLETLQFTCGCETVEEGDTTLAVILDTLAVNKRLRVIWNHHYESLIVSETMKEKTLQVLKNHGNIEQFYIFAEDAVFAKKKNDILW